MKKFLIPTGVAYFPGTYSELLRVIYSIDGKLENDDRFRCELTAPSRLKSEMPGAIVRGRLSFLFHCNILRADNTCKIAYRVYPSFLSIPFLICVVCVYLLFCFGFPYASWGDFFETVIVSGILGSVFTMIYLVTRRRTIRRFIEKFEGNSEGIFE